MKGPKDGHEINGDPGIIYLNIVEVEIVLGIQNFLFFFGRSTADCRVLFAGLGR
jgi:hypothetical protein